MPCWSHISETGVWSRRWSRRMATFSGTLKRFRVFLDMGKPPLEIVAYSSALFFPFNCTQTTAALVLAGQLGDCSRPGEHLDGHVSPLLRRQLLGRTRNMNSCRSWPVKRSRSRSGITLRDRDRQSSLTIHVCFLRETVLVGTNHPNMEEPR